MQRKKNNFLQHFLVRRGASIIIYCNIDHCELSNSNYKSNLEAIGL